MAYTWSIWAWYYAVDKLKTKIYYANSFNDMKNKDMICVYGPVTILFVDSHMIFTSTYWTFLEIFIQDNNASIRALAKNLIPILVGELPQILHKKSWTTFLINQIYNSIIAALMWVFTLFDMGDFLPYGTLIDSFLKYEDRLQMWRKPWG